MRADLNEAFEGEERDREPLSFTASAEDAGKRTDIFVSEKCGITRSAAGKLIEEGNVTVGDKAVSKSGKIKDGDTVEVLIPEPEECNVAPENIPLDVVYEDGDVIVVNKPAGMVVHPAPGHSNGTLVSALLYHCRDSLSAVNGVYRQGIVHRIDKDTTGLIAAAKNDVSHNSLASQLKDHSMHREYLAILVGRLPDSTGTVDRPIGRNPSDRKKMAVARPGDKSARNAVTHYEVIGENGGFTLARMRLETGRTHQIRVHMASVGHPVLGDEVYGGDKTLFQKKHPTLFKGQMLHAARLTFVHPSSGETVSVTAPPPDNFIRAAELCGLIPEGDGSLLSM